MSYTEKALREALDTLVAVVGLTAFKYEGQRKPLQEAIDNARAALSLPETQGEPVAEVIAQEDADFGDMRIRFIKLMAGQSLADGAQIYAAPAAPTQEAVLDKPASIGSTRFGKGVKVSTVIAAAQRLYEYQTQAKPTNGEGG